MQDGDDALFDLGRSTMDRGPPGAAGAPPAGDDAHTWMFQSRVAPNCSTPCTFLRNAPGTTNWPHGT